MPIRSREGAMSQPVASPHPMPPASPEMRDPRIGSEHAPPAAGKRAQRREPVPVVKPTILPPPPVLRGLYLRVGTTLALIAAAVVGCLMWYYGAGFTLAFLKAQFDWFVGFTANQPRWVPWAAPVLISAGELFLWPHREYRFRVFLLRLFLWGAFLGFDVYTTYRGVVPSIAHWDIWIQDGPYPYRQWFNGLTSVAVGLILAYMPEKIARWVLSDLWAMWATPVVRRLKQTFGHNRDTGLVS